MSNDPLKRALKKRLNTDPLLEAEKLTGESYKDDKATALLGILMHLDNSKSKEDLLALAFDTFHNQPTVDYLRLVTGFGFKVVLKEDFTDTKFDEVHPEIFYVLFHDEYGMLLVFDTYREKINGGNFYYNWEPNNKDNRWNFLSSGHYIGKDICGERLVWAGHHDCREALKLHIEDLVENGTFITPWIERPFLWLCHHGDKHPSGKIDHYDDIRKMRLEKLPEYVQVALGPERK